MLQSHAENGVQKAKQQERRSLAIHFPLDWPVAMEAAGNNVIVDVTAYGIRLQSVQPSEKKYKQDKK